MVAHLIPVLKSCLKMDAVLKSHEPSSQAGGESAVMIQLKIDGFLL